MTRNSSSVLGLLAVAGMFLASNAMAQEGTKAPPTEPYRIQPGDVLAVAVWKEPDLQADVLVRPDGGFTFPLVGEIVAEQLTLAQLQQEVAKGLQKFLPEPSVTIALKQLGGNRIYVLGKVNRPGEFLFSKPIDVMQALSLAGGTTPFAANNDIRVLRRLRSGTQVAVPFKYGEVERGQDLSQNMLLKSGDTVVVP
jgi:polysaccharide export outer membrane protein